MGRENIKERIVQSIPALGNLLGSQNLMGEVLVTGAVAGDVAVADIKLGDNLVSVIDLGATPIADLTSEFTITGDGIINNTGGSSTATNLVKVLWEQWILR